MDVRAIPDQSRALEWLDHWPGTDIGASWGGPTGWAFIDRAPAPNRYRRTRRGLQASVDRYPHHVPVATDARDRLDPTVGRDGEVTLSRIVGVADLAWVADSGVRTRCTRSIGCPAGVLVQRHSPSRCSHADTIARIGRHQRPAHTSGQQCGAPTPTVLTRHEYVERGTHADLGITTVRSGQHSRSSRRCSVTKRPEANANHTQYSARAISERTPDSRDELRPNQ